jgi:predicted nucleotidyltransferase
MKTVGSWNGNTADIELLEQCKAAIREAAHNADVILYGSRARGDEGRYSDYDLLILVDRPADAALEKRILDKVYPLELETGAMFTLIVYNTHQWDSALYRAMPFHQNVEREGVML